MYFFLSDWWHCHCHSQILKYLHKVVSFLKKKSVLNFKHFTKYPRFTFGCLFSYHLLQNTRNTVSDNISHPQRLAPPAWDAFLEKPVNFSGPNKNWTCWMVAQVAEQFLAHKPVNFASLFYFILFYVIRFALKITKTKTKKKKHWRYANTSNKNVTIH